ncbi:collagen alpha-1(I) chain-like [Equus przewalskii]|uniref:Collagen alpha-1(I) chain-like n=1 Tax=Equus przewalskii TaxID=9798 RepID=A0ABM4LPU1_EQUPR
MIPWNRKQQAFALPSLARPVLRLCTHHSPPPPAVAAGTGCSSGRQGGSAPSSFRPLGHKSAPEGKEAARKGLGNSEGWLARPEPGAGEVTSAAKVEQVLVSPSPPGEHLCPPPEQQGLSPRERSGRLSAPGRPGTSVPLGCCGRRGAARGAQVSAAAPPSGGKGLCPRSGTRWGENFRSACPERPEGLAGLPEAPAREPTSRAPRPSPSIPPPPSPRSRGLSPSPHLFSSTTPEKFGRGPRPGAPHSPRGQRSRSAPRAEQRAAAGGGASARLLTAAPAARAADRAEQGEAAAVAAGSPARSPTPPRDAAQRRPGQPAAAPAVARHTCC